MRTAPLILAASFPLCAAVGAPGAQVILPLSFGGVLVQPFGGRITLTPQGSLLPEGPGAQPGASPAASYARIRLVGPPRAHFRLRFDPANPALAGSGGGAITLAAFLTSLPASGGTFDGAGEAEVAVGGTLDVSAGASAGPYSARVNLQLQVDGCAPVVQSLPVSCVVRSPLTLTALEPLDFAAITPGGGGVFRVGAVSGHTMGGAGPRLVKGTPHPALFRLTGPAHTAYTILLPREATLAGPRGTIRLIDFTSDPAQGLLPPGGLSVHVGASLDVKPDQAPGAYRGVFQVTVAYQ